MMRVSRGVVLAIVALAGLFSGKPGALHAVAADCAACATLGAELAKMGQDENSTKALLAQNEGMLKTIAPTDTSKRIKLSSNILILSAKVETLHNNSVVKQQDFQNMGCPTCPK